MLEVKKHIVKRLSEGLLDQKEAVTLLKEIQDAEKKYDTSKDIAIIGISCRLPMSEGVDEYRDNLINGRCCFTSRPADKLLIDEALLNPHYQEFIDVKISEDAKNLENIIGGFIADNDKFDAAFFNISPREALYIDPQQRVFLELAWAALEDAGYSTGTINNTKTGVFVGKDYSNSMNYKYITKPDTMKTTGNREGLLASRLSYAMNLTGPTMVIDTACSSGLVAIHEAISSIHNGECEMAIAGGLSIGAGGSASDEDEKDDDNQSSNSALGSVSSNDNRVRTFDKKTTGSVFGEGVVVFILKPLDTALNDNDHIYALIKGSSINNDGSSNGITAPNPLAQASVIKDAWKNSKVDAETIDYIEAHGTGTLLGDPIEILGITKAFDEKTNRKQFCGIGSVKTNIGHLVAASGPASLLKVTLALKNELIPPSINFEEPNKSIDFTSSPVYVVDKATKWERSQKLRRAGINSFGFSGTNCHLIVEEAPIIVRENKQKRELNIITFSAKTETSLKALILKYSLFLENKEDINFDDMCYTQNTCRGHYNYRISVLAKSAEDLKEKIDELIKNNYDANSIGDLFYKKHKIVSERYENRENGELTEKEAGKLSKNAQELTELLSNSIDYNKKDLRNLASLYALGAGVIWKDLYKNESHQKLSLPSYCFDRISVWAEPKRSNIDPDIYIKTDKNLHPILNRVLLNSYNETIFEAKFDLDKHRFVKEHKIMGSNIVPGTAYIEVVKAAASEYFRLSEIEIESLTFIQPLIVSKEAVLAHIAIRNSGGKVTFSVASKDDNDEDNRILNAEGTIKKLSEKADETTNLLDYSDGYKEYDINISDDETDDHVYMGPRWHSINNIYEKDGTIISEISLDNKFKDDLNTYKYHPAIADAALNIPLQIYVENSMYLPLAYKGLKIYKNLPQNFISKLVKISGGNNSETMKFKADFYDENGNLLVKIDEYTTKKVGKFNSYIENSYYKENYTKIDYPLTGGDKKINGDVLILSRDIGISDDLSAILTDAGKIFKVIFSNRNEKIDDNKYLIDGKESSYARLLEEAGIENLDHIIHLGGVFSKEDESYHNYQTQVDTTLMSLFHLPKILLRKINGKCEYYLFATDANMIKDRNVSPMGHAFLSMVKTLIPEYTNYIFHGFDIEKITNANSIYEIIKKNYIYPIVSIRDEEVYLPVLEEVNKNDIEISQLKIREDGIYVITGGTGGLGIEMAKYLAEVGAKNICLLSRHGLPNKDKRDSILEKNKSKKQIRTIEEIRRLENRGVKLIVRKTDVSDFIELKESLGELIDDYGKINGVIHCAGIAGDGFLYNKSLMAFNEVIEPKIKGSIGICELLEDKSPDFIVFFSSMQTLFGGAGQGDYTAANSYLDALSCYMKDRGLNVISINRPGWKETGMAVDFGVKDTMTLFKSLTNREALNSFDYIINHEINNVIAGELNYEFLSNVVDTLSFEISDKLVKSLARYVKKHNVDKNLKAQRSFNIDELIILGRSNNEYSDTERCVATIYARVLDLNEIDTFENFNSMGGDSIIAVEVLKQLNEVFNDSLNISDMFTYPCVAEMAEYIESNMAAK